MKLFRLDSWRQAARLGLAIGIPLALLFGARGLSWAFDAASGWAAGETLRAEDLNRLMARLDALEADPFRTFEVTISDNTVDLGEQLAPLVAKHRDVAVTLARGATDAPRNYTWNKLVVLPREHRLHVAGEGYGNGAAQIGATITMNAAATATFPPQLGAPAVTHRVPARLHVAERGAFRLAGVKVYETENNQLPLTPDCNWLALFAIGDGASITLEQITISSTETIVAPGDRALGHVVFGWTTLSKPAGVTRDVHAVSGASGWCHPGSGAFVGPTTSPNLVLDGVLLVSTEQIRFLH